MSSFVFKNCCLYVNGEMVAEGDEVIKIASDLSLEMIPTKLRKFGLTEDELEEMGEMLSHKIFWEGECLPEDGNL